LINLSAGLTGKFRKKRSQDFGREMGLEKEGIRLKIKEKIEE
jgi:hypothetical protein